MDEKRVAQNLFTVAHDVVMKTNIKQPLTKVKQIVSESLYITRFQSVRG